MKEDKIPLSSNADLRIPSIEEVEASISIQNSKGNDNYNCINNFRYSSILSKIITGRFGIHKVSSFKLHQSNETKRTTVSTILFLLLIVVLGIGLSVYLFNVRTIPSQATRPPHKVEQKNETIKLSSSNYPSVSFTNINVNDKNKIYHKHDKDDVYPKGMTENMKNILMDKKKADIIENFFTAIEKTPLQTNGYVPDKDTILFDNIYWGPKIESALPQGFGHPSTEIWERYVNQSEIVKMEVGCGRMQNRLVTFKDGMQACVRYRQNTDQIQGEIFSFYLGKFLNLSNLAPSVVKVVDLKDRLWSGVAADITASQWNTNRAVVLTQYIPSLESATIPDVFKPSGRHLNKFDVLRIVMRDNDTIPGSDLTFQMLLLNEKDNPEVYEKGIRYFSHVDMSIENNTLDKLLELAQWADLIIFDYLTANLDRIVNNLFNYQWNANIMDGPAHNLAKQMDSGLLVFLDNESGLLHGYRLLKKYNVYHSLMLENLCVFRQSTIDAITAMYELETLGSKLDDMYHNNLDAVTRDVLPPLPDKNKKILHERLGKIINQVKKCEQIYGRRKSNNSF